MTRRLCFLLLVLATSLSSQADETDARGIYLQFVTSPQADAGAAGGGIRLEDSRLTAILFSRARQARTFQVGIDYQYTHFDYEGLSSRDRDLHRLQVPVTIRSDQGPWQWQLTLAPGVSTSSNVFKDLANRGSGDDLTLTGYFEAGKDGLLLGFASDRRFGAQRVYPVLGIKRRLPHVEWRLAFPVSHVTWSDVPGQSLQARVYPAGHEWRVTHDDRDNSFDYELEAVRAEVNWRFEIAGSLHLDILVGYEFNRRHGFESDSLQSLSLEADDQWIFGLGFSLGGRPAAMSHSAGYP